MSKFKHIVFDLGGVLIELGKSPIPSHYFRTTQKFTLEEWFLLPEAHDFERGHIDATVFGKKFISDFKLDISVEEFIQLFSKWPQRVYPGVKKILTRLNENYHLSVLSNCNEIHWPIMEYDFEILQYFQNHFSSHLVGMTKPDPLLFAHVVDELKADPQEILFFDDNEKNVEAAEKLGINSVLVDGINDVKEYLVSTKILNLESCSSVSD